MMANVICTVCPKGCHLKVDVDKGEVSGNGCRRGVEYGLQEVTNPMRILTTTVSIKGGCHPRLPIKTSVPIPKEKMMEVMSAVERIVTLAPVKLGDVIVRNILGTGADLIACRSMDLEGR